jgi:peptidoglycan/xylan/chitin deacetylase (PgdA/CDA1 family)
MISVVYHKIKKFDPSMKFENFLHVKNFNNQIRFFKKKYKFFNCENLFEKKNLFKKKNIFLTFDDGLKGHYKYVLPILRRNKINGIFYLATLPFQDEMILPVHKVHIMLACIKNNLIIDCINKNLDKKIIDENNYYKFEKMIYKNQTNANNNIKIKKILNYYIGENYKKEFIGKIFQYFFPTISEKKFVKKYYLSEKEIKQLIKNKMILGAHTVNHHILSNLSFQKAKKEINKSFDYLKQFTNYKTFSYPYGTKATYNYKIKDYLNKKKVSFSVTVGNKEISESETKKNRQEWSRYDCNRFQISKKLEKHLIK